MKGVTKEENHQKDIMPEPMKTNHNNQENIMIDKKVMIKEEKIEEIEEIEEKEEEEIEEEASEEV